MAPSPLPCWLVAVPLETRTRLTMRAGLANLALVLMIAADETAAATAFADRNGLLAALQAWCADSAATIALHGPMKQWDVSAVTDMNRLIHYLPCKGTFNEARAVLAAPTAHSGRTTRLARRRIPRRTRIPAFALVWIGRADRAASRAGDWRVGHERGHEYGGARARPMRARRRGRACRPRRAPIARIALPSSRAGRGGSHRRARTRRAGNV